MPMPMPRPEPFEYDDNALIDLWGMQVESANINGCIVHRRSPSDGDERYCVIDGAGSSQYFTDVKEAGAYLRSLKRSLY